MAVRMLQHLREVVLKVEHIYNTHMASHWSTITVKAGATKLQQLLSGWNCAMQKLLRAHQNGLSLLNSCCSLLPKCTKIAVPVTKNSTDGANRAYSHEPVASNRAPVTATPASGHTRQPRCADAQHDDECASKSCTCLGLSDNHRAVYQCLPGNLAAHYRRIFLICSVLSEKGRCAASAT